MHSFPSISGHPLLLIPFLSLIWFATACGPVGSDEDAPAFIEFEPQVLQFAADKDATILTLWNTGGLAVTFSVQFSAESGGVTWLDVEPTAGSLEGGGRQGW